MITAVAICFSVGAERLPAATDPVAALIQRHCLECHDADIRKGDLNLAPLDVLNPAAAAESWV